MATSAAAQQTGVKRQATWRLHMRRRLGLWSVCALIILLIPSEGFLGPDRISLAIDRAAGGDRFDLVSWEVQAIGQKLRDQVRNPAAGLSPQEEHDLVLDFMEGVRRTGEFAGQIEAAAAGVGEGDLVQRQASLQSELDELRETQEARRPAVERILQEQVSSVLDDLGFTTLGQIVPPVSFQFTESPNLLIVSPRERIQMERDTLLDPAMALDKIQELESQLAGTLDRSTLVEGTGGLGSYPTMVLQNSILGWVVDTVAHEWAHTYLMLHPLGWNYGSSGGMRTINETVASIFGEEIGQMVLEKYYPELVGPTTWPRPLSMRRDWLSITPVEPDFEFGPFMRETRLQAEKLLAEGKIEEAEAYMEARRQRLVEQGYAIRKLNQAYFAFHGSYAVGASATDPIGGKLAALRLRAGSLPEFMRIVSGFNDAADLDAALAATPATAAS